VDENLVAVKGHQKAMSFAWSSCEVLPGSGSRIIELDCKHLFCYGDDDLQVQLPGKFLICIFFALYRPTLDYYYYT
jgi:hypothetical protein